jgi:threonine/homoserine/homoserine lactone efflux protein
MEHLTWFAVLVFGIVVLPGMDMAFVMASALVGGRRAGLAAVGGIVAGGAAHVVIGSLGVGLLLQALPGAFNTLLVAGALYLGWIGLTLLRSAGAMLAVSDAPAASQRRTFVRALATCLMNPKAYLFTMAVFPQFIRPDQGWVGAQMVAMGAIVTANQALVYGAVALGAAGAREWLRHSGPHQLALARAMGALLLATAVWTLWHGWQAH